MNKLFILLIIPLYMMSEVVIYKEFNDTESVLYQEESDNEAHYTKQWYIPGGGCPLEDPESLSYQEEQERKAKEENIFLWLFK